MAIKSYINDFKILCRLFEHNDSTTGGQKKSTRKQLCNYMKNKVPRIVN
jgi:hypothetical protein